MFSASRTARPARRAVIARTLLAAMLLLVLLAGVVPLSSFASQHECGMACCIGKPAHMAGSCSVHLGEEEEEAEPPAEMDEAHSAHDGHMAHQHGATAATTNPSSGNQGAGLRSSSAHHSTSKKESARRTSVVSQTAITKPCSPDCAAAASAYSQVRRPRDPAQLSVSARPRPPTLLVQVWYLS